MTATTTTTLTAESIFALIEQLSAPEQLKLQVLLLEKKHPAPITKPPLDKRVPCQPMPDRTREWEWVKNHEQEYAGQWVALEGDRLVAASFVQRDVFDAIKADGANRPLIHHIPF